MDFLLPTVFQDIWDVQMVRWEEMVVLAQTLQRCAVQSGMPQGMLCRAVQELCKCLAPLLKKGDLLNLTILDVMEKDPVTPHVPTERASSPEKISEPREEEQIDLPAPNKQPASEPEKPACSGELALAQRILPLAPPVFTGSWSDDSVPPLRGIGLVS